MISPTPLPVEIRLVLLLTVSLGLLTSAKEFFHNNEAFRMELPWVRASHYISFMLYTRENTFNWENIKPENASASFHFKRNRPTKVVIHGFTQTANEKIFHRIKDAYLKQGDYNIILVDWEWARYFSYTTAAAATTTVAKQTALLLKNLKADMSSTHVIGFSLGAHTAGMTGSELNGDIARITGLDPAMLLFRFVDKEYKLDSSDAKFVDVIHTDGGDNFWLRNHLGMGRPSGHADFYPNKGLYQPGCPENSITSYEELSCSHTRALDVFAESIENKGSFTGCRCDGWYDFLEGKCGCSSTENIASMGEPCSKNTKGKYYLITKSVQPFGMGLKGSKSLRAHISNNATTTVAGMKSVPSIRGNMQQIPLTDTLTNISAAASASSSRKDSTASSSALELAINTCPIVVLLLSLVIYCACKK